MDSTALDIDSHQISVTRRVVFGSEYPNKVKFLSHVSMAIPWLSNLFSLGMLALILTVPCRCGVEGINFTFNGFQGLSDVYVVPNSGLWTYYPNDSSIFLDIVGTNFYTSLAGRILYPEPVQMMDPVTMTAKSFSTNFIYQILAQDGDSGATGSGMAFIMVPDNITLGAPLGYMGLLTTNTSKTIKNYMSDDHTFGVEFDTYWNLEFDDPNNNHIGIDLASMNSTKDGTFIPTFTLATETPDLYQQVWIDYFQADARMDIYITQYGQDKPTTPFSKSGLDLSFLNDYMYIGFSAAVGIESSNFHTILAWSFSTDGPAPPIWIASNAPPAPSPPPPGPSPRRAPPPPSPNAPPPRGASLPTGPVAAPNPSPNASPPASPPPPPTVINPTPIYAPSPPPPVPSSPAPFNPPGPSPLAFFPHPGPSTVPPSSTPRSRAVSSITGISFGVFFGGLTLLICCWKIYRVFAHPIPFFLAHSSGKDGTAKNFTEALYKDMKSTWRYKFFLIRVFFDRGSLPVGEEFPEEIKRNLSITRVGVVIITEEFFTRKWPMTELLYLVESHKTNRKKVQILPLFYKLKVEEVKELLSVGTWNRVWESMSTENNQIDVQKCGEAVRILCQSYGIEYNYTTRDHDAEYRKRILKEVGKMCTRMVLWS